MQPLARLIGLLALVYPGLLVYGSLFPLAGWTASGIPVLAFLSTPFPRYWTVLDLAANLGLYLPLGFLWTLWLLGRPHLQKFWWIATLPALAISLGVEVMQNWLPSRVASNVDLACNTLGAIAGVLLARAFGRRWLGQLASGCTRTFRLDGSGDIGLLLLIMWFVGQWVPEGTAFVLGDWRSLWTTWPPDWAPHFEQAATPRLEAIAVAAFLLTIGLMVRELLRQDGPGGLSLLTLLLASAATGRALAGALMVRTTAAFDWLTFGAQVGVLAGVLLLLPAFFLPAGIRRVLAPLALLCGTLAINLTAPDPYSQRLIPAAAGGAFSNFAGLTGLVAALWPLAALAWWASRWRRL